MAGLRYRPRLRAPFRALDWQPPTNPVTPGPPQGLQGTALSGTAIGLSWAPPVEAAGVTQYRVYRGATAVATVTSTTHTDTGLTPGTTYQYSVSALFASGAEGPKSLAAQVATPSAPPPDTTPPSAPTGLTATRGSGTTAILAWAASSDAVGVTGYRVERDGQLIAQASTTGYTDSGLAAGQTYRWRVKAVDAAGNASPASNEAILALPAASDDAPATVASYGPNGTHWPEDTPWMHATDVPHVVTVDCTWAAIKAAVNSFTPLQVQQGARINVRPGVLPGNGASGGSTPAMQQAGSDQWGRRILIRPRDGYGTVRLGAPARLHEVRGVTLAGLYGQTLTLTGCTNSAVAWSRLAGLRLLGQGNSTPGMGYTTSRCDAYEVVIPDSGNAVTDPAGFGAGYPANAGNKDGNGWLYDCTASGCYVASRYLPEGSYDHLDTWQLYGSSIYWGFTFTDCALWGANNASLQIGGFSATTAETDVQAKEATIGKYFGWAPGTQIPFFLRLDHNLLVYASTAAATRYPLPAGSRALTTPQAVNGGGGSRRMDVGPGNVIVGTIYSAAIWRSVHPSTRIWPTTQSKVVAGGGTWTVDNSLADYDNADYDALNPVPSDEYLTSIWT